MLLQASHYRHLAGEKSPNEGVIRALLEWETVGKSYIMNSVEF